MLSGLRNIVSELREGSDQIASATSQIAATAEQSAKSNEMSATAVEEVTSTVHELSTNIQTVSKKPAEPIVISPQTSSSIEEMVTSIARVAETSEKAKSVPEILRCSNLGKNATDKSSGGIEEINKVITRSAETIVRARLKGTR